MNEVSNIYNDSAPQSYTRLENSRLRQQIANLKQHNEVLLNCWTQAKQEVTEAYRMYERKALMVESLQAQVDELLLHLNPRG